MGFFGWVYDNFLMSEEEKRRKASVEAYSREMKAHWAEYRPKLEQARERWANTQKEMYRKGGTTALGLTVGMDEETGIPLSDTRGGVDEQAEFEDTENELRESEASLKAEIEQYKADKAEAISRYSNPE